MLQLDSDEPYIASIFYFLFFNFNTMSEYYFHLCICTTLPHVSEESGACVCIHEYMKLRYCFVCHLLICMISSQTTKQLLLILVSAETSMMRQLNVLAI